MNEKDCIIYVGEKFSIEWYYDKNGKSVAYEYFQKTTEDLQDKFLILVKKMAEFGKILDLNPYKI